MDGFVDPVAFGAAVVAHGLPRRTVVLRCPRGVQRSAAAARQGQGVPKGARQWKAEEAIFVGRRGAASEDSSRASPTVPAGGAVGQCVQQGSCASASSGNGAEVRHCGSAGRGLGGGETPSFVLGWEMAGYGDLAASQDPACIGFGCSVAGPLIGASQTQKSEKSSR